MGKAATLTVGKSILIGGEHWVTVNQIDSGGKNVKLYVHSPETILVVNGSQLRKSNDVTEQKT